LHLHRAPITIAVTDESMEIPTEWLCETGVLNFVPMRPGFRCTEPHVLIALRDIEPAIRTVPLDGNGFAHDRLMRILVGIRVCCALPPIPVERIEGAAHQYRLRGGVHRFYASRTLRFSHIPAEIGETY
jgi:hypothetical protein